MTWYPAGNVIVCRFPFVEEALTEAEQETFFAGGGLPSTATPVDPTLVLFDWIDTTGTRRTVSGLSETVDSVQIVRDAAGEYHASVPVPDGTEGQYQYRGYGQDGSGNPVASSGWQSFETS